MPVFPGHALKNDALFLYGAIHDLPFVYAYVQERIEVVHGPSCKSGREIFESRCILDQVPIIKRRGGGGTVVLAPGMVILIVVGKRTKGRSIRDTFSAVHRPLGTLLKMETNLDIQEQGISDLAVEGRKILGSSLYMTRTPFLYYYQSSLLVETDSALITRYLRHPPREPDYRKGRGHDEFCTSLKNLGIQKTPHKICTTLVSALKHRMSQEEQIT
ncbi:MAG: hypothetical protein GF350_00385 [Chitinivibrionales bacterium]|nr:hypothetical protein [Chitinivibrionales bacterium]